MAFDRCIFAARAGHGDEQVLRRRAERVADWFRPLAPGLRLSVAWDAQLGLLAGVVDFGGAAHDPGSTLVWGGADGVAADARAFVAAEPVGLRNARGVWSAIAVVDGRARIATGAVGLCSLYRADGGADSRAEAWSSHAVAAALLAGDRARVDWSRVPELVALEFVAERGTIVAGVEAVASATVVDLGEPAGSSSYWPPAERWELLPERDAYERAERALLEHLGDLLAGRSATLGLTAGADSRVVAAALRELGLDAKAFTWGESDWPDTRGAAAVAAALGFGHDVVPVAAHAGGGIREQLVKDARWNDGTLPPGVAQPSWPSGPAAIVTGAGGEVGRAFYYRLTGAAFPRAQGGGLERATAFAAALGDARREDRDGILGRVRSLLDGYAALGLDGKRPLDAFYAEQRVRHWGRSRIPAAAAPFVPGFVWPEIERALVSLPLDARMSDGFHRRFLAQHAPASLVPPPPAVQRAGVPPAIRRAARRVRDAGERFRPRPSGIGRIVDTNQELRAALTDALERPELDGALGERWVRALRRGFEARAAVPTQQTLQAAGALALADALAEHDVTPSAP